MVKKGTEEMTLPAVDEKSVVGRGLATFARMAEELQEAREGAAELGTETMELRLRTRHLETQLRTMGKELAAARQRGDHYMAQAMTLMTLLTATQTMLGAGLDEALVTLRPHAPLPPEPEPEPVLEHQIDRS